MEKSCRTCKYEKQEPWQRPCAECTVSINGMEIVKNWEHEAPKPRPTIIFPTEEEINQKSQYNALQRHPIFTPEQASSMAGYRHEYGLGFENGVKWAIARIKELNYKP